MPDTAFDESERRYKDAAAPRRFADHVLSMLRDFIPYHCHRDAHERLSQAALDQGFELTSTAMRKEYEAWKTTQLEMLHPSHAGKEP